MKEKLEQIVKKIELTQDVNELKNLNADKELLLKWINELETVEKELSDLKESHESLKEDYIKAVRNQPALSNEPPVHEEKTDAEIYAEWKEGMVKNE